MLPRVGAPGPSFWRVIEVRGSRLALVLGRWWEQAEHDDGHLRLEAPRLVGEAWSLSGAFRPTAWSRWLPVELQLSPRFGSWTLLELIPRRPVHPNAVYFRVGHSCLDRFVETLHTYDAGAEPPRWSVAANGLRRL